MIIVIIVICNIDNDNNSNSNTNSNNRNNNDNNNNNNNNNNDKDNDNNNNIVAIFHPFSQFCEINISLPSLQKQPNTAPNLFWRGVDHGTICCY